MKATVKVAFREGSKQITAEAKVELEDDSMSIEELKQKALEESKDLMNKALAYSTTETMRRK